MADKSTETKLDKKSMAKKILWVSSIDLSTSLHQKSKIEIMESLAKRGYVSDLIAIRSTTWVQTANSNVHLIPVPLKFIPAISSIMYAIVLCFFMPLYSLIFKPDYIITDPYIPIFSYTLVFPISKIRRIKLILDIRSTPVEIRGFRGFSKILLFIASVNLARRLFDGITIITPLMKKEICTRFGMNPETIGVWSSGFSIKLFDPELCRLKGESLRKQFGLAGRFVVLYQGWFTENRGLIETIRAMSEVKNDKGSVVLMLLGTGPSIQKMKELVQEKRLQSDIIIHGPVEHQEIPDYISMCDVGIVPLPDIPFWRTQSPLKLVEYLAMGKVAIITSLPAHRAVVRKEKCGIYISSANPVEIAKCINYAYQNRDRLKSWGASGRKIVEEAFTWEKVAADLESYLISLDHDAS